MRYLIICVALLLSGNLFAQDNHEEAQSYDEHIDSVKTKHTWAERRAIKKEELANYLAWERKYFNSPGKWYMSVEAGYGFPFLTTEPELVPPLFFLGNSDLSVKPDGTSLEKLLLSSQGGGTRLGLSVGKMFNRFIGMELKFGYFSAKEDNLSTINRPKFKSVLNTNLSELSVSPQLVFQSPNMNNWYVVGKIGPFIPQWGNPRASSHIEDEDGTFITGILDAPVFEPILEELFDNPAVQDILEFADYKTVVDADVRILLQQDFEEYSFKELLRAIGVNASLGFRYQPSPIVSIFGELAVKGYNISLSKIIIEDFDAKLTLLNEGLTVLHLTEEGGNLLGLIDIPANQLTSLLETRYLNELKDGDNNPNYTDNFSPFRPRDELAPRLSVVSVGFNIGLQINFPGRHVYYRENSRKAKK